MLAGRRFANMGMFWEWGLPPQGSLAAGSALAAGAGTVLGIFPTTRSKVSTRSTCTMEFYQIHAAAVGFSFMWPLAGLLILQRRLRLRPCVRGFCGCSRWHAAMVWAVRPPPTPLRPFARDRVCSAGR